MKSDYFIEVSDEGMIVTFRRRESDFYRNLKQMLRTLGIRPTAIEVLKSPRTADNWP